MTGASTIEYILIGFLLYGLITGFIDGFWRKLINVIAAVLALFLVYTFAPPIVNALKQIQGLEFPFLSGSPLNDFISAWLSAHVIGICVYILLFIIISFILNAIKRGIFKKMYNVKRRNQFRRKQRGDEPVGVATLANRVIGGLWGLVANTCFAAFMLLFLVPLSGLEPEIAKTTLARSLYQTSRKVETLFAAPDSDEDEGISLEAVTICSFTKNQLTLTECDFLYQGSLMLSADIFTPGSTDATFSTLDQLLIYEGEDKEELFELNFGMYFKALYAIPTLMILTGPNPSNSLRSSTIALVDKYLNYATTLPNGFYHHPALEEATIKMYQRVEFNAQLASITRMYKSEE